MYTITNYTGPISGVLTSPDIYSIDSLINGSSLSLTPPACQEIQTAPLFTLHPKLKILDVLGRLASFLASGKDMSPSEIGWVSDGLCLTRAEVSVLSDTAVRVMKTVLFTSGRLASSALYNVLPDVGIGTISTE